MKLARALLLAALLAPSTLVVDLSPEARTLAAQPGASLWAVGADGTLAEGLDDEAHVSFNLPEGSDADRVLLIGGTSARWARRGPGDVWTWDTTGYVVAGKLPEALRGAYVDVLRALDGQVAPPVDALFPTFSDVECAVDFVLGVPAPGRYELVFDAERGARRALATCEALPEAGLVRDKLPTVVARPADLRLALTPPKPLPARGALPAVLGREQYPRTVLDGPLVAERAGKTLSVRVPARVLAGRLWIWSPGWRALLVEGAEFSEEQTTVARKLEAGRKLVVHVRDAAGAPIGIACVELQDADERPIVAAFDPRGDEGAARLDVAGRAGPGGDITVFGLPAGALTVVAGRCAAGQEPAVAEWDGKGEEITVTVE